jgi:hypothetical protein
MARVPRRRGQNGAMPFTVSHVAAVLPLLRITVAPAALVIGSMVPDLPYFLPLGISRELSHSPVGVLTVDLPLGLLSVALWLLVFRAPLWDFAPRWLRKRWHPAPVVWVSWSRGLLSLLLACAAILIGVATHLLWDSLTHPDGPLVLVMPELRHSWEHLPGYRWLQYLSSVAGIALMAVWAYRWARRTKPSGGVRVVRLDHRWRAALWAVVATVLVGVALLVWTRGLLDGVFALDRVLVYNSAVLSVAWAGLLGVVACLVWYLVPRAPVVVKERGR